MQAGQAAMALHTAHAGKVRGKADHTAHILSRVMENIVGRDLCKVVYTLGMKSWILWLGCLKSHVASWFLCLKSLCLVLKRRILQSWMSNWVLHITVPLLWPCHTAVLYIAQQPLSDSPAPGGGVVPAALSTTVRK